MVYKPFGNSRRIQKRVLGIDPGIANTGLAIVETSGNGYQLVTARLIKTEPNQQETERLLTLFNSVDALLNDFQVDLCSVERIFHNRNVKSSIKTGKAIGAILTAVARHAVPSLEITPQQVKAASGLGMRASKADVQKMLCRMLKVSELNDHIADACGAAIAGGLVSERDTTGKT